MSLFFFLLDCRSFHDRLVPPLAESWRRRSFGPCQSLCRQLLPAAAAYAQRYQLGPEPPLLTSVLAGLLFDRALWRALVGELLTFAATDIPLLKTAPEALTCLLAPDHVGTEAPPPAGRAPIQQAHCGSRDLAFGLGCYRPDHAGFNDHDDVARLADYLSGIDTLPWRPTDLAPLHLEPDERREELEFARECLDYLRALYRRAREGNEVIVCEEV